MVKKALRMIGLTIVGGIFLFLVAGILFLNLSPQFGGKVTKDQQQTFQSSPNFKDGKFINIGFSLI